MDILTDNHLEDQRPPSVIDPQLRFADRHRNGLDLMIEYQRQKPLIKLLFIRGQNRDVPQTAIIHYQN